jgi:hypothetical protein
MGLEKTPVERKRALIKEWAYMRPIGPHMEAKKDIEEMADADVERLLEIGDEMAKVLR